MARAGQTGRYVGRDQRRFEQQRAGAAHRIEQGTAIRGDLRPTRADQQRGREVLLERRATAVEPIAAPVQTLAGEIEADRGLRAMQMDVDGDIRLVGIDIGTTAVHVAEAIGECIFHAQRREVRMRDRVRAAGDIDRERARDVEQGRPVDRARAEVERIGVRNLHEVQRQQHAAREPRPQAGAIGIEPAAVGRDAAATLGDLAQPEAAQLLDQQRFQSARAAHEQRTRQRDIGARRNSRQFGRHGEGGQRGGQGTWRGARPDVKPLTVASTADAPR